MFSFSSISLNLQNDKINPVDSKYRWVALKASILVASTMRLSPNWFGIHAVEHSYNESTLNQISDSKRKMDTFVWNNVIDVLEYTLLSSNISFYYYLGHYKENNYLLRTSKHYTLSSIFTLNNVSHCSNEKNINFKSNSYFIFFF